jgi:hypothetical protein
MDRKTEAPPSAFTYEQPGVPSGAPPAGPPPGNLYILLYIDQWNKPALNCSPFRNTLVHPRFFM